jgi:hypothetical protein
MTTESRYTTAFTSLKGVGAKCETVVRLSNKLIQVDSLSCGYRELILTTGKRHGGGIETTVRCGLRNGPSFRFVFAFARGEGDLSEKLEAQSGARCAERFVRTLHSKWYSRLPELIARARAYYNMPDEEVTGAEADAEVEAECGA